MSDTLTDGETEAAPEDSANVKQLREKALRVDEATTALAAAQRKIAVLESGIDAETPLAKMFLKAYDGDFADTEALIAAAKEIGVPMKGVAVVEPVVDETPEPNGTETRQELAAGAPADTGVSPDPNKVARDVFDASIAAGKSSEAAVGEMLASLAQAGLANDARVLVE